jgi:glycosyltransferase involved in cell wall biosynthesis
MQSSQETISIIIPALNEEDGIGRTLASIPRAKLEKLGYKLEVIVVDGGSTDFTEKIALQMGAKAIIEKQKGYGRAYKVGLNAAKGDTIVTLDADATYPAELIPEYIQQLNEKNVDFITVNRFSKMEESAMSVLHRIGNKILSFAIRLLYSVDLKDSQSGMWIMKKKNFVDRINLNSDGMSISEEIKIIAFKFFKSIELDGEYYTRVGTTKLETFKHGWDNLLYLFKYRKLLKFAVNPLLIPENKIKSNPGNT